MASLASTSLSVPQVSIANPASWTVATLPSSENRGVTSMLEARTRGEQSALNRFKMGELKQAKSDRDELRALNQIALDAHKAGDARAMNNAISDMARISPESSKAFKDSFAGINRTDLGMAAMNLSAAAFSETEQAQNTSLQKAYEILSQGSLPLASKVKELMDMPYGDKRSAELLSTVPMMQSLGILPAPKDVFGAAGSKSVPHVANSKIMDDGTIVGVMSDETPFVRAAGGKLYTGKEAEDRIAASNEYSSELSRMRKKKEAISKGQADSYLELVDVGKRSAKMIPDILKSIDLLGSIPTGGTAGFKLWAKKKFGLLSENEQDLTTTLARRVLEQLKTIFGGNFVAKEGAWLESIEPGIGQSTEGNIRVLKETAKKFMEYADWAREEALIENDMATVRYIDRIKDSIKKNYPQFADVKAKSLGPGGNTPPVGSQGLPKTPVTGGPGGLPTGLPQTPVTGGSQMPQQAPPQLGRPMQGGPAAEPPAIGREDTSNAIQIREYQNAVNKLNQMGIPPDKIRYNSKTGQYGYEDESGRIVPIKLPPM